MKKVITILIAVFLVSVASALDQPKIAVYGFRSQTFSRGEIASLNSVLESALMDLGHFKVLTREDIKLILKERKLADTGLVEPEDFGKMIGAKYVIFGSVERSFGKYGYVTVSVKIIDIDSGEIVFADASNVPMSEVEGSIREIVSEIGYGKEGIYKRNPRHIENIAKKKEKGTFFSMGIYYVYYEDDYGYMEDYYIPMLRYGTYDNGTTYGVNLLLGGFYRKYFGVFYGEVGTVMLFVPYIEGGLKLGPLELSLFDVVFPGISITFTF